MTRGKPEPAIHRFDTRVEVAEDGCWLWTGAVNEAGYAVFNPGPGLKAYAHRWIYEQLVGPIGDGLVLDHRCHTDDLDCDGGLSCSHRRCVNPGHLEPVTRPENVRRSKPATKRHCVRGHEFDEANTRRPARGGRQCRACAAERQRARVAA